MFGGDSSESSSLDDSSNDNNNNNNNSELLYTFETSGGTALPDIVSPRVLRHPVTGEPLLRSFVVFLSLLLFYCIVFNG
jgi:hypothetical protein